MEQVIKSTDYQKAQKTLAKNLLSLKPKKVQAKLGVTGGLIEPISTIYYFEDYEFWWCYRLTSTRHWNAFGFGDPTKKSINNMVVQVNFPVEGSKRTMGGVVATTKDFYLFHTGKIGGSKKGVGKEAFLNAYKITKPALIGKKKEDLIHLGRIKDKRLIHNIMSLAHQVYDFKATLDDAKFMLEPFAHVGSGFKNEFFGKKNPVTKPPKEYESKHGLVVKALHEQITSKKIKAENDGLVDLYTYKGEKKITIIFEIKTNVHWQSIYKAVGQLKVHSSSLKYDPKLVFVYPDYLDMRIIKRLESLDILTLAFGIDNDIVTFHKLDTILAHAR